MFQGRTAFHEEHPTALAVYCSDGRFTESVEELLRALGHERLDTLTRGPRQLVPPRARGQARPAREDEVAGPSLHEPARHLQAEAAHASGD